MEKIDELDDVSLNDDEKEDKDSILNASVTNSSPDVDKRANHTQTSSLGRNE